MYQPPQGQDQPRYFGLTGTQLNAVFLLAVAVIILGVASWLFSSGGIGSISRVINQVRSEVTLLINGRDVPSATVDAPEGWIAVTPTKADQQAIVAQLSATSPELGAEAEQAFSYFGGLELLYFAFDPQSPPGSLASVNIIGQRYGTSTSLEKELSAIEQQGPAQGITLTPVTRDITVGGYPAAMVGMRYTLGDVDLEGIQYAVLVEDNLVYAITFVTTPDRIEALTPTFQQVAGTFRLLED